MIFSTSKEKKHSHFALITDKIVRDPQTGEEVTVKSGITTLNNGHAHNLVSRDGQLVMLEAGKVAHIHELEEELKYIINDDYIIKENDDEEKGILLKNIKDLVESEEDSIETAEKCVKYYNGEQWSEADKNALNNQGRPALTINELASKVDLLTGFGRQNRTDVRFYPVESSDATVSDILTEAVKNIFSTNDFQITETSVFTDQIVAGRGVYHTYVDYDKNLFGKIVVEQLGWKDVAIAPHIKSDLSDCEMIVKKKRVPKKQLILEYPDKKDEISNYFEEHTKTKHQVITGQEYLNDDNTEDCTIDPLKQTVVLKEVWQKVYDTIYSIVDYENGSIVTTNQINKSDIKSLEELGLAVVKRTITNMQVNVLIDDVILDSRVEDQDFFPIIPVYCKKDGNKFVSKLKDLLDLQDEINKRHSQSVDIINKVSSYGYFYDSQTFDSTKDEMQWKRDLSKPGWTSKVRDLNRLPYAKEGVRFPSELVNLMEISSNKMNMISGISNDLMGGGSEREVSSVAIIEKRRNSFLMNEYLFDNLSQSKKLLAKNLLKMIQKTYSADRLFRLVGSKTMDEQQQMKVRVACEEIINSLDLETYDVAVDISKESTTTRSANFSMLMEMARNGMQIPPEVIIQSSDIPNKDQILGILTAQSQAATQSEQLKYDTEIQKTKIAAGLPSEQNPNAVPSQGQMPQQM